jgi:type I restriction enzyme S subunit
MNTTTFFEKFALLADAPNAVAKMRELVLELAVQGKLVAQSPNDETALLQLERIAAQKAKTGRVARVKAARSEFVNKAESTTHLPAGWAKAALADLVTVLNGRAYSKDELLNSGTPLLRVGNLFTSNHWYYSDLDLEPDKYCDKGDLIFAWSASFGPFIWPGPKVIYHYHIWKLELHSEADLDKTYLYWFLQNKTQEIKKAGHGVSMLHMTKEKMEKLEVMLPPLAEQKRIVAKVDELMALCDQLEAQQREREEQQAALSRASLARFSDTPTPANLNFLFHTSYNIAPAELRKSILTLAVQGKLVPQDPADESVEVTLTRNDACRRDTSRTDHRAAKENQTLLSAEDRWAIPDTWAWRGLADIVLFVDYRGKTPKKLSSGIRLLTAKNVRKGQINLEPEEFLSKTEYHAWMTRGFPKAGDVLFTTEAPIGNAAVVNLSDQFALAQRVICFQAYGAIEANFLVMQILSEQFQFILDKNGTGVTAKGIKASKLKQLPIAIPPLAEQRRIVAKVDELMALVEQLEAQLASSRSTATALLDAVVAELTGRN